MQSNDYARSPLATMFLKLSIVFRLGAVLSYVATALADEPETKPCTVQSCHNSYDLSALSARCDYTYSLAAHVTDLFYSSDYVFESFSGRNFTLNVCKPVVSEMWNPKVDNPKQVGGFVRGAHGDLSIGCVFSRCIEVAR